MVMAAFAAHALLALHTAMIICKLANTKDYRLSHALGQVHALYGFLLFYFGCVLAPILDDITYLC